MLQAFAFQLIPNTAVKPYSSDGTSNGRVASCQDKAFNFFQILMYDIFIISNMYLCLISRNKNYGRYKSKSESEVLDEEFIQASTDFERVSTRIIEIMTSPQFFQK